MKERHTHKDRYYSYLDIAIDTAERYNHVITNEHKKILYNSSIKDSPNILLALKGMEDTFYPINKVLQLIRCCPPKILISLDIFNCMKDLYLWYVNLILFNDLDFLYLTHSFLDIVFALYVFKLSPEDIHVNKYDKGSDISYIGDYTLFYELSFELLKEIISDLYATIIFDKDDLYINDDYLIKSVSKLFNRANCRYALFGVKTELVYHINKGICSSIIKFSSLSTKNVNLVRKKIYLKYQ